MNRKNFIRQTVLGVAGIPLVNKVSLSPQYFKKESNLKIGIAGFTFLHFDVDQSVAIMKRLDLHYVSLKDFHLPLDSNKEKIDAVLTKFNNAGIKVYAVGVIYMKSQQDVDNAFDYAKRVGVNMIVGAPLPELLPYAEQKVKSFNIKLAIHNHGPEDPLYPSPKDVYDRIENMDERMGLCLDIGHATRAGTDLEKAIVAYQKRLFDMHIKDVTGAFKDAKAIEIGRGVIDFAALIKTLKDINYTGVCSIEFEKDMNDPIPGIAESVGYFKGTMNSSC